MTMSPAIYSSLNQDLLRVMKQWNPLCSTESCLWPQLNLSYCAYSKHHFSRIYNSAILLHPPLKLAVDGHSSGAIFLLKLCSTNFNHVLELGELKTLVDFLTSSIFKKMRILYAKIFHALRWSGTLPTVLLFKCKWLRNVLLKSSYCTFITQVVTFLTWLFCPCKSHWNKNVFKLFHWDHSN